MRLLIRLLLLMVLNVSGVSIGLAEIEAPVDHSAVLSVVPDVVLPSLQLIRQDGTPAIFPAELDDGKPVLLTFVYTSCKAVCPVISHVMKSVQTKLGSRANQIHMASITVDPEFDTPDRLNEYAHQLEAGPQWIHYTGRYEDIISFEKSFSVYRGDKMNHVTVFYVRRKPSEPWSRFINFVNPDDIIKELGL